MWLRRGPQEVAPASRFDLMTVEKCPVKRLEDDDLGPVWETDKFGVITAMNHSAELILGPRTEVRQGHS